MRRLQPMLAKEISKFLSLVDTAGSRIWQTVPSRITPAS